MSRIEIGEGYRKLRRGEMLREGDEFYGLFSKEWRKTGMAGAIITDRYTYRRRLKAKKGADSNLLQCPFCGKVPRQINGYFVECTTIDCTMSHLLFSVEHWNRRTSPWIDVKVRLPEESGTYIFRLDNGMVYTSYYYATIKLCSDVAHWMPIPPLEVTCGGAHY